MDLGRVVSFASTRGVELACDSSSGRGVGQKGVSPVWLGRLKVTHLIKPGASTDLEACSLPQSPEEAPSTAMAPLRCRSSHTASGELLSPAASQLIPSFPAGKAVTEFQECAWSSERKFPK